MLRLSASGRRFCQRFRVFDWTEAFRHGLWQDATAGNVSRLDRVVQRLRAQARRVRALHAGCLWFAPGCAVSRFPASAGVLGQVYNAVLWRGSYCVYALAVPSRATCKDRAKYDSLRCKRPFTWRNASKVRKDCGPS